MDASRAESRDQACRLRVMEDGDVTGTDDLSESSRVARGGLLILAPVLLGQLRAIRVDSVQQRMDLFGHVEKVGRAFDHNPPLVDAGVPVIRDQGRQQLGHAAPARRRVHVPQHATAQRRYEAVHLPIELRPHIVVKKMPESFDRGRPDLDLVEGSFQLRHIWENAAGRLRYATSATRSSSPTSSDIAPSSSVATERASSRERCAGERPSKTSRTGSPSVRLETARTTPPSCGAGAPSACSVTATSTAR